MEMLYKSSQNIIQETRVNQQVEKEIQMSLIIFFISAKTSFFGQNVALLFSIRLVAHVRICIQAYES